MGKYAAGICLLIGCIIGVASAGFCETRADKRLESDILNNMIFVDPASGKPVAPQVVWQKIFKVKNDATTGQWQEIWEEWQLRWNEREAAYIIKLIPAVQGGVDYQVTPKKVAVERGMLEEPAGNN